MGAQFSDYEFGFRHGERYAMDRTSYKEGSFNISTDSGSLSIDIEGKRVELTDIITGYSEVEIRAIVTPSSKIYLANDTYNLLVFDTKTAKWRTCSAEIALHAQMADQDSEGNNIATTYETKLSAAATKTTLQGLINNLQYEISTINKFNVIVLPSKNDLPDPGEKFVIYFIPNESYNEEHEENNIGNYYIEYIWVESLEFNEDTGESETIGHYEQIGIIAGDLSDYCKKSEVMTTEEIESAIENIDVGVKTINVGNGITTNIWYTPEPDPDHPDEIPEAIQGGPITSIGAISLNLKSDTMSPHSAEQMGNTEYRQYAVGYDVDGYPSVNIPWENTVENAIVSDSPSGTENTPAENDNVYVNLIDENSNVHSSINIRGTGSTSVTSDEFGRITISSTNQDTIYDASNGIILDLDDGKYKANLKNYELASRVSQDATNTLGRQYPVMLDAIGKLSVNIPWTDTTYNTATDTKSGVVKLYNTADTNTDGTLTQDAINSIYATKAAAVTSVSISNGQLIVAINGIPTSTDIELDFGEET